MKKTTIHSVSMMAETAVMIIIQENGVIGLRIFLVMDFVKMRSIFHSVTMMAETVV